MKKPSKSQLTYQKIATKREVMAKDRPSGIQPRFIKRKIFGRVEVIAPQKISFFNEDYLRFINFISEINNLAFENKKILINLQAVDEIKAAAMLVLYANIEQILKQKKSNNFVKTTKCSSKIVSRHFSRFGIWSLTNEISRRPRYAASPNTELEICTASVENLSVSGNDQLRNVIRYTQNAIASSGYEDDGDTAFAAITESVSNVGQHAYAPEYFTSISQEYLKNWWIIVHHIENQFFIAVYDMGAGIPQTISDKPWLAKVLHDLTQKFNFASSSDATLIKAAVEYGRSRFKLDNRGKGLSDARDFVDANPEGKLIIYSATGYYSYSSKEGAEKTKILERHFTGTLLQWNLKLDSKT